MHNIFDCSNSRITYFLRTLQGNSKITQALISSGRHSLKYLYPNGASQQFLIGQMILLLTIWVTDITFSPVPHLPQSFCPFPGISSLRALRLNIFALEGLPVYSMPHWLRRQSISLHIHIKPLPGCSRLYRGFGQLEGCVCQKQLKIEHDFSIPLGHFDKTGSGFLFFSLAFFQLVPQQLQTNSPQFVFQRPLWTLSQTLFWASTQWALHCGSLLTPFLPIFTKDRKLREFFSTDLN